MWWFKWRPRTRGRSKSQQIITTWQHAVIKIQGFMHFPSSPPEQRPLGDCTKLSFKRTVLTKWWARTCFLSWRAGKKLGWPNRDEYTWIPWIQDSCSVWFLFQFSQTSPLHGQPQDEESWGLGEWIRDICKALGLKTWAFFFFSFTIAPSYPVLCTDGEIGLGSFLYNDVYGTFTWGVHGKPVYGKCSISHPLALLWLAFSFVTIPFGALRGGHFPPPSSHTTNANTVIYKMSNTPCITTCSDIVYRNRWEWVFLLWQMPAALN